MCLQDSGISHYSSDGSVDCIPALPVTTGLAEQELPKFPEFRPGINNLDEREAMCGMFNLAIWCFALALA